MYPGVGRLLIRVRLRCEYTPATPLGSASGGINDRGRIVGEYYDHLSTDANSPGLRRSALDAERPLGPLVGLRLGQ